MVGIGRTQGSRVSLHHCWDCPSTEGALLTSLYMFHLDPENSEKKSKQDFKDVISLGIFKKKGNVCVWGAGGAGQEEVHQTIHSGTLWGETGRSHLFTVLHI